MMAAAMCGMSEDEFWSCTPRFFIASQKAMEEHRKFQMVMTRQNAYWNILPHVDTKKQRIEPKDLGLFYFEQTRAIVENAAEMLKEIQQSDFWEWADRQAEEINAKLRLINGN